MCLVGAFNKEKALVGAFSVIVKTDGSFAALTIVPRTASARYITVTTAAVNMRSRHRGDGAKLFYVFCNELEEAAGLMTSPGSEATHYLGQVTQPAAHSSSEGMGINIYRLHKY